MDSLANSSIVTNDNDNAHVEDVTVNAIARAEDGDNTTTAINVDGMSEGYEEESNSNGKKATKKPTSSLKQKKLVKEKLPKKGKPALNPKLQSVKNLVEAQPTTILQSKLFALAESNLVSLLISKNKELGLTKLSGEDGYVPISVRFDPTLIIRKELENDQDTMDELIGWKEDIATCKKALANRIKRQVERNNKSMDTEHQKRMVREMITLGAYMAGREKILYNLAECSVNNDVLAKGAVINFFESLPWFDKYLPSSKQQPLKVLFKGTITETLVLVKQVCSEKVHEAKWADLIHTGEREIERKRFFNGTDTGYGINTTNLLSNNNNNYTNNINNIAPTTPAQVNRNDTNNITPTNLPPPPTTPVTMAMLQLFWNGQNQTNRNGNGNANTSSFDLWKQMELEAQRKELEDRFYFTTRVSADEISIRTANIRVSDQIFIWMMEVFPELLSKPFIISREESRLNRADALLRGNIKKAELHTLAQQVEERLEKDDEHIHIGKSQWKTFVTDQVSTEINKRDNQKKRKNSSREDSTASLTNTKSGDNGNRNKRRKVRFEKTKTVQKKSTIHNPYKKDKQQTPSPNKSKGKHAFRPGGKKQHQQHRRTGGGRGGRGHDRNNQGRGGRR